MNRRAATILCATTVFLYWMALYLYVPTLSNYVETKVGTLALVGVVLSQYGLWQGVVRLPLGIASDWLERRKPFVFAGLLCAGLGAVAMALADDVNGLAAERALTGFAASAWVPLVVMFSAFFPPEEAVRASALLTFIGSLGRMVATALAVGGLGAALAPNLLLIFAAQVCIGLSQGIGYPVLMGLSIEQVSGPQRATAMGLHQAMYAAGMFAGPWLSGILADTVGIRSTVGGTAVACLGAGLVLAPLLGQGGGDRGAGDGSQT